MIVVIVKVNVWKWVLIMKFKLNTIVFTITMLDVWGQLNIWDFSGCFDFWQSSTLCNKNTLKKYKIAYSFPNYEYSLLKCWYLGIQAYSHTFEFMPVKYVISLLNKKTTNFSPLFIVIKELNHLVCQFIKIDVILRLYYKYYQNQRHCFKVILLTYMQNRWKLCFLCISILMV